MNEKKERWKMISGYDNYAVSTKGRVRNLNTGKLLKHQYSERAGGYPFINLCKDGKRVNRNVHVLVAKAFLGRLPKDMVVDHRDDNRRNPNLDNLRYVTHSENNHHNKKRSHKK